MTVDHGAFFTNVRCACGLGADVVVSYDQRQRQYVVEVKCMHRGRGEPTIRQVRYDSAVVAKHTANGGLVHPLGGSMLEAPGIAQPPPGTVAVVEPRVEVGKMQPGDLVREGTHYLVVLTRIAMPDGRQRLTTRRVGDDAYRTTVLPASASFPFLIHQRHVPGGDVDAWVAQHEAELARVEEERARRATHVLNGTTAPVKVYGSVVVDSVDEVLAGEIQRQLNRHKLGAPVVGELVGGAQGAARRASGIDRARRAHQHVLARRRDARHLRSRPRRRAQGDDRVRLRSAQERLTSSSRLVTL